MALVRVNEFEVLKGRNGKDGLPGKNGKDGVTRVITEIVETPVDLAPLQVELDKLRDELTKLKKRRPEQQHAVGGTPATRYLAQTTDTMHWKKDSFIHGITVIGVRYSGAATVYLPHDLDPTMLVSVKDESGSGNITVIVE